MKPERPNVSREELMRALTYGLESEKTREAEIFTDNLPLHSDSEARLYGSLCSRILERLEQCQSKVAEWKAITEDYNTSKLVPALFELKGRRTERALRRWVESYQTANFDCYALIHQGRAIRKGRKVTGEEQAVLLNILLTPRRVKIGTAITRLKQMEMLRMLVSPSSIPTLKRWCQDWSKRHPAEWAQARNGSKYVSETIY